MKDNHHSAYRGYLIKRRSPAAMRLLQEGRPGDLEELIRDGVLERDHLMSLMRELACSGQSALWLQALQVRSRIDRERGRKDHGSAGTGRTERTLRIAGRIPQSAEAILQRCRMELYTLLPYMDLAIFSLKLQEDPDCSGIGTDGEYLYYRREEVIRLYTETPWKLRRTLLHTVLHCLYLHPWEEIQEQQNQKQKRYLGDLIKDIRIEQLIERECRRDARMREKLADPVQEMHVWENFTVDSGRTDQSTAQIALLEQCQIAQHAQCQIAQLEQQVRLDDHRFWGRKGAADSDSEKKLQEKWKEITSGSRLSRQAMQTGQSGQSSRNKKGMGAAGLLPGDDREEMDIAGLAKSRTDYKSFLQQFAVFREELEIDMDSFDYTYYHLGLDMYGSLPLLEPLEYREGHKLEELVIAIDTSGSIKTETARRFLEEIYAILDEKENFFSKMNVVILQCDCVIEDVAEIHGRREWEAYLRDLTLIGRAGTDFRPVFQYIEKQRERGEMTELKGLLYYTDGDGIYPREAPDYQTAFVFVEDSPAMEQVPKWAQVLRAEHAR